MSRSPERNEGASEGSFAWHGGEILRSQQTLPQDDTRPVVVVVNPLNVMDVHFMFPVIIYDRAAVSLITMKLHLLMQQLPLSVFQPLVVEVMDDLI